MVCDSVRSLSNERESANAAVQKTIYRFIISDLYDLVVHMT